MTPVRSLTSRSTIFTLAFILQSGIAFILIPVYTARLTPADYGILSIATAIGSILTILYLQSMEGVFVRFYFDFRDEKQRRLFFGSLWIFQVALVGAFSLALEVAARSAWVAQRIPIPYDPYIHYVVWTSFVSTAALLLPRAVFLVRDEAWNYAALNLGLFILSTSSVIWFVVVKGEGAAGSVKGTFLATLIVAVPLMATVARSIIPSWSMQHIKAGLAFALPLVPHLLSLWALDLVDRLILRRYVSLADVGIYTLGYQLGSIPQLVAYAISSAIAPFYYRTADSGDDARMLLSRMATYYVVMVIWVAVVTVSLGDEILALIATQPGYVGAQRVVPWVALGSALRGFYFVFVSALYYTKRITALPIVTAVAAASNIALNLFLIPRFGYMAAAFTTLVTFALQAAMMFVFARRAYPLPYEWGRLAFVGAAAVLWVALLAFVPRGQGWLELAGLAVLAFAFPIVLWLLRLLPLAEIMTFYRGTINRV